MEKDAVKPSRESLEQRIKYLEELVDSLDEGRDRWVTMYENECYRRRELKDRLECITKGLSGYASDVQQHLSINQLDFREHKLWLPECASCYGSGVSVSGHPSSRDAVPMDDWCEECHGLMFDFEEYCYE